MKRPLSERHADGREWTDEAVELVGTFRFSIEIEGLTVGLFSECTGLEDKTEPFTYAEGGVNSHELVFPGQTKLSPLRLKSGVTVSRWLWDWRQLVLADRKGEDYRRTGSIMLLDPAMRIVRHWTFIRGWPSQWSGPTLDAFADTQIAVESIEIMHEGLSAQG